MAADVRIDIAAQFVGKPAFKQAENSTEKLMKSVKNLASAFGVAFGARAIVNYSKAAVKAFAADDKAARALTLTLSNLGMAFADPEVKAFIKSLEAQYGVIDDLLRPAYQKLVTTTGDYKKSQELLKTALDLAALSGTDVVSTSNDLAKAYAGSTRSLMKYGLGLSKTELQSMKFEDILKQIAIVSEGQAEAAADSYSGALDRLTVASQNASESIGRDLITALDTISGGNGLPKTIGLIETLAGGVGDAVIGFSRLIRNIGILASGNPIKSLKDLSKATQSDKLFDARQRAQFGGIYATQYQAQAAKGMKSGGSTGQIKATKALTKATQDALKLSKAKAIFDLQKIQIEAALKGKITEEERIRLKLMQAIEDENITQIEKYSKLLDEVQAKTKELRTILAGTDPFKDFNTGTLGAIKSVEDLIAKVTALTGVSLTNPIAMTSFSQGIAAGLPVPEALSGARYAAQGASQMGGGQVNVTVNAGVGDPEAIARVIEDTLRQANYRGTTAGLIAV